MASPALSKPQARRFWQLVDRGFPAGCWPFLGSRKPLGYGYVSVGSRSDRRNIYAHRIAWELTYGPIPSGLVVCHRCDNPPCCNPAHLFLGTKADNTHDMETKGRDRKFAKVSNRDVAEMRAARATGASLKVLAARFGVSESTACQICNRTSRRRVA